ncbi:hypothetical protein RHSIM_Rhsim01G0018100 [Rhododendron simsii]|uniref:Uncharacterized protein n=1 Tax=Rhododendron simsii TaxID=118357 RepID=A0A834HIM0_RHOSS|nr:hypothetical protein RHSIM_Rhsim01G0018100 [Rhododendron simsii]
MEGDNIHWIENYRVDLRTIVPAFLEIENNFKYFVLCVFEGEENGDYSLVLAVPGKVISYNLNCKKFDVLCDLVPVMCFVAHVVLITLVNVVIAMVSFRMGAIHWVSDENGPLRFDVNAGEVIAIHWFRSCYPLECRILELDKNYCGWIVKCRINPRPLFSEFPEMGRKKSFGRLKVLCVMEGDNEKGEIVNFAFNSYADPFVETLFPV